MRRPLRVYIASSWKNAVKVRKLAEMLREKERQVFDFTDPEWKVPGLPDHFVFNASKWMRKPLNEIDWLDFLREPITEKAFTTDKAGIDWADVVVLFVPSGRSAHLETGYAVGQGKPLFIYGDLPGGEFDVMYHFAKACIRETEPERLLAHLELIEIHLMEKLDPDYHVKRLPIELRHSEVKHLLDLVAEERREVMHGWPSPAQDFVFLLDALGDKLMKAEKELR